MTDQLFNCYGDPITLRKPETYGKGYPAAPGTGPEGETCRTCTHKYRRELASNYYKCLLMKASWTGGKGTDILLKSPACSKWGEHG